MPKCLNTRTHTHTHTHTHVDARAPALVHSDVNIHMDMETHKKASAQRAQKYVLKTSIDTLHKDSFERRPDAL